MKRLLMVLCLFVAGATGWYYWSIHSYRQWFHNNLVGAVWTPIKDRELAEVLCQPYRYCGQGSSSKAYVSEDGRFIIKTFIKSRFEAKKLKYIPFLGALASERRALKAKYKRSLGPINAYQYMPKESGMIFYQFIEPRDLFHKTVSLVEKDGSISQLDLDKDEYVIQKKAVLVADYLRALVVQGDLEKVKQGISKLLRMTKVLYDQGIVLSTLQFLDNFGFVEDEPIRIDVEHLRFDPKWKEKGKRHLRSETAKFRTWIIQNAPAEVLEHFDSESQAINGNIQRDLGRSASSI